MAVPLWATFSLFIGHSFQLGILLPPQNVALISENFYTFLTWDQSPDSTNSTQYEVEKSNGSYPDWVKEPSCKRRNLRGNRSCQLHLPDLFKFYQARVRAQDGGRLSEWAYSNWLQLYKDTVVGPLILSLAAADHSITASVSMPQIRLEENELVFTSLLKILVILSSEGGDSQKVMLCEDELNSCWMDSKQRRRNITKHTFENLKSNTNYCVKAEVANQPTREAVQCIKMPASSTGGYWTLSLIVLSSVFGLILLSRVGKTFLKQYMQLSTSETDLPKSLVFLNRNSSALIPALHLEADSIVLISTTTVQLPSEDGLPTEQENSQFQLTPGSLGAQGSSDYCPNGFDKDNEDPSCLSVAVVDTLSSGGLEKEDNSGDEDYRSALALLESSEHPSPSPRGFHFGDLETVSWECRTSYKSGQVRWLSSSGADIPLSSLKLQVHLDTQGLVCSPGLFDIVKGCDAYAEAPAKQVAELQVYWDQSSFLEDSELRSSSSLEVKDTMTMSFPGYELHQPILFCEP